MNSEDIARYVADLENTLVNVRYARDAARSDYEQVMRNNETLAATVERLRAAAQLPEVGPARRAPGYDDSHTQTFKVGNDLITYDNVTPDACLRRAANALAVHTLLVAEAEAESPDATPDTAARFIVGPRPTYMGHHITREYVTPGEVVAARRIKVEDGIKYAFTYREKTGSSLSIDMSCLTPVDEAQVQSPDTSRVSFGTRHEGTRMVLLQHDHTPSSLWGMDAFIDAQFHRGRANDPNRLPSSRAAHAALAEVREALNTAEAAGVDVQVGGLWCHGYAPMDDEPTESADARACRFLAREVQALVERDLRGGELNGWVPYLVRDHRAPVQANTDPDNKPCSETIIWNGTHGCINTGTHLDHSDGRGLTWKLGFSPTLPKRITLDAKQRARRAEGGAA
jgi:hypothetical protein